MTEAVLNQRVDRLEDALAELAQAHAETEREMARTSREVQAFRFDMAAFSDKIDAYIQDSVRARAAMDAKSEEWRREMAGIIRDMRREWGELSRKMGTMAEDLVAPSVPRILRTVIGCPDDHIDSMAVRVKRSSTVDRGWMAEFDVVAVCGAHALVNETKSTLAPDDVKGFVERLLTVRQYFPEFEGKAVIGAIASLYVDESIVRLGEKQGLIVLGFGEDVMDVLNSPGFVPRAF
jgi:hypothetical protein